MAKAVCVSCLWEAKTNKRIDGSRTNTSWAKKIGISEASIRRHRSHAPIVDQATSFVDGDGDEVIQSIDVPEEYVTSRGMSLRDPVTGSWQKITWQPNKKALHDSLNYDDLRDALDDWEPHQWSHYQAMASPQVAVLNMADLQIGKANQRWGGTPETLTSARKSIAAFVQHIITSGITTVVLVDNGDPIENCFNVPSQLVTNDLPVPEQIRVFRRLVLEAFKAVAPYATNIYFVTMPSNHGAHRTGYKSPGGTVDADFGLEISYQLEDVTNESIHLSHIKYVRPRPLDETTELTIAGTKLAFNHGHQSGGVFKHGNWWKGMDHGRMAGWDADIFVFGHFHTQATYQSGDGRWVIGTASSDPGSDWYTNRTGESSTRGMTAFDLDPAQPGVPLNIRIV